MRTTRREFLSASMAVGTAAAVTGLGTRAWAQRRPIPPEDKKRILILGGTAFLGPACMDAALARGHKVTLFNRGRIEQKRKESGRPLDIPAGVEELYGNRDPYKTADDWKTKPEDGPKDPNAPKGLTQLEGKSWDAVIDTSGFWPRIVRVSAESLAPRVKQYIFISSLSAYVRNDAVGKDESDEVAVLKDPDTEDFGKEFENYGAGKAACEAAAEKAMPGRTASLRAGFIVGPRDTSGRFIYWPLRVERGGEMAVPGKPTDPIQLIDVRDLAEWIVHLIETNTNGVFNATGPERTLTMLDMLQGCAAATTPPSNATFTFMDAEFLKAKNVSEGDFPLWIAPEGENAGFHQRSVAKAVAAGLRFRSVQETAKGTLAWYHALPSDIQPKVAKLLPPEREEMLLKDWKERAK